ncbi:hypothetical protein Ahy_B06g081484 [Arachis hypogaea]|uniref:Uncharacterized protein n=1 Tax=Arachis hypogaea TaxID=3818 RepID=A0A444YL60_ARAHY|nr:hypothetical protein Ahy_B06g081484 [Arachis hypogaea]
MRLRSGRIIHMADEMSNVNGGSSTNNSIPGTVHPLDVTSRLKGMIISENITQQMTTILNPMMADHESKFERLAKQIERIARIVDYDEGKRHDARGNNEAMESSEEESDLEAEIDLAELKKGPPYVCSLLKKLPGNEKSNDSKLKSGKRYSFDISKFDQIFYVLLKDKQLILLEDRTLLSVKDLKGKPYCKFHQATSHSTNNCVRFRDLIQEAIMEGHLKFDEGKKEMKVDSDLFNAEANFVEPFFGVNMVGMSYDFNVVLGDFELEV